MADDSDNILEQDRRGRDVWRAYLGLLGRQPDNSGFENYVRMRLTAPVEKMHEALVRSPEFEERTRERVDDVWWPDFEPRPDQPPGFVNRQSQKAAMSRENLWRGPAVETGGRIAVVCPYPPAATGVAMATAKTFAAWPGGVDFFAEFETPDQLRDASNAQRERGLGHRVFNYTILPEAIGAVPYRCIVFAFGASRHNVHVVYRLLKMGEIAGAPPVIAYVHDPVVFPILRRAAEPSGLLFRGMIGRAYGARHDEEIRERNYQPLMEEGRAGFKALTQATRIDRIVVNSRAARIALLRDDPNLDPSSVQVIFHPVFSELRPPPIRVNPTELHIGCFGVAAEGKRLDVVIETVNRLVGQGVKARLTIAGYQLHQFVDSGTLGNSPHIRLREAPGDAEFLNLMAEVDVAVQLRNKSMGETSGVVSLLMGLGKPVVVTRSGAFLEFGDAVRFVDPDVGADALGAAILAAAGDAETCRRKALEFAAAHTAERFCAAFDAMLAARSPAAREPSPAAPALVRPPPDWAPPRKTCLIAFSPRTGSTYLSHLMRMSGVLGWPMEFFNPDASFRRTADDTNNIAAICRIAAEKGRSPNGVVSFKLLPEHFDDIQRSLRLSEWFPEPHWVRVKRRDLLGQAISLAIAGQTQRWDSSSQAREAPVFSIETIENALARIVEDEARWDLFFTRNAIRPLTVVYEELERDPLSILQSIAVLIGVDPNFRIDLRKPPIARQRTALNEDWRALYVRKAANIDRLERPESMLRQPGSAPSSLRKAS